jgi:hypothetical protein
VPRRPPRRACSPPRRGAPGVRVWSRRYLEAVRRDLCGSRAAVLSVEPVHRWRSS